MEERDESDYAILNRYRVANEIAILSNNRIAFDSLRDVFFLVGERKKLLEKIALQEKKIEELHDAWDKDNGIS